MTKQHTNMLNRLTTMFVLLAADAILCAIGIAGMRVLIGVNLPFFACLYTLVCLVTAVFFNLYYGYTAADHDWKFTETYLDFRMSVFSFIRWLESD